MLAGILSQRELGEIEQRDKARTQGAWQAVTAEQAGLDEAEPAIVLPDDMSDTGWYYIGTTLAYNLHDALADLKDAEFIAHCSTDIPRLLETVRILRELLRKAHVTYAQHLPGCLGRYYRDSDGLSTWPCNCGYREWQEEVKRVLEGTDGHTEQG